MQDQHPVTEAQTSAQSLRNSGIVYVLSNPAMEGYLKIGRTQGNTPNDVITRMQALDGTPVPLPFDCEYAAVVEDYERVELALHKAFGENRVRENREFFEGIPPFRVKAVLELLEHEDVTPDPSETYEGIDSGKIRKRPAFKMSQAGIPEGSVLEWAADPERTCTVITNNRVEYEGKEYPISELTATLKGWKNKYAPYPSQYWIFNGQTLHERRENLEAEEASEG